MSWTRIGRKRLTTRSSNILVSEENWENQLNWHVVGLGVRLHSVVFRTIKGQQLHKMGSINYLINYHI
jgi:hypothetical protein